MPYNPNLPLDDSLMVAGQMRSQFNGLKTLIDEVPAGPPGPPGPQGPQGEVSAQQLDSAIMGTARNPTGVEPLYITVSDPPTQAEVQAVVSKLNELIAATRREP